MGMNRHRKPNSAVKKELQKRRAAKDELKNPKDIERYILPVILLLRVVNVFAVQTSFVPDEYWQSLEVAHNSAFGYGYLTWEWTHGIRSYAYPAVFTTLYRVLKLTRLDTVFTLALLPRVLQGILSGAGDWFLYHFVKMYYGKNAAYFSLLACLTSWFWWYCATRTIINTLETSMLCIGLYYYPWKSEQNVYSTRVIYFQIIAISISVIRPTAAVIWVPLALWHVIKSHNRLVLLQYTLLSVLIFTFSSIIDYFYYGKWILVHWNFFIVNVAKNLAVHYGTHPWHWYLTQGVAVVLGTQIIFFAYGVLLSFKNERVNVSKILLALFTFTVFVYSLLAHKEFRFILQLVPISSVFCGVGISNLSKNWQKISLIFLLLTNVPVAVYFGLAHQRGSLDVMKDLHQTLEASCNPRCPGELLFLTPCHATPLYSHLHINVTARFLECPPNLYGESNYLDEGEKFHQDPKSWLSENIFLEQNSTRKYTWIVLFDYLYNNLKTYEPFQSYEICKTVFHTHFPEGKMGQYIYMLCHKD